MKRILFVDDDLEMLKSIRRMLRFMRREWDMVFTSSGEKALQIMAEKSFDVLVTDIRMPGMDGVELLTQVRKHHPSAVRIVLSGHVAKKISLVVADLAHQFLSKPCEAETLITAITQTSTLAALLEDEKLQQLLTKIQSLPSLPNLYIEIMNEFESPDPSSDKVGEIISRDQGMSAKVLQLVNSAFFGIPRHVANPAQATVLLGLDTIRDLVLTIQIFSQFDKTKLARLGITGLWDHGIMVGSFAKTIAKTTIADKKQVDHAFTAGLLHDVGKLVFAENFTMKYFAAFGFAKRRSVELHVAEREIFGATHAQVGAYLLGLWGLPDPVVEAIAFHHDPGNTTTNGFTSVTAVHIANVLDHEIRSHKGKLTLPQIDSAYLTKLGVANRLEEWKRRCLEQTSGDE